MFGFLNPHNNKNYEKCFLLNNILLLILSFIVIKLIRPTTIINNIKINVTKQQLCKSSSKVLYLHTLVLMQPYCDRLMYLVFISISIKSNYSSIQISFSFI